MEPSACLVVAFLCFTYFRAACGMTFGALPWAPEPDKPRSTPSPCASTPQNFTYVNVGKFSSCPVHMSQPRWTKDKWDGKVLIIHGGPGQFGNQLFYAAATLVAAAKYNRPIIVLKSSLGWGLGELPCLQSSLGLEAALAGGVCNDWPEGELLKPNGIEASGCLAKLRAEHLIESVEGGYQQDLARWGSDPESFFPLFREAFSVQPVVADLPEVPGQNDLVLYFRSYAGESGKMFDEWNGCQRLLFPPVEFFKHAIERHQAVSNDHRAGRVWVVSSPEQRKHPTIQRLMREHHAVLYSAGDKLSIPWLYDFAWITAARHVATSFSTFGWWATVVGNPTTVYVPIMPGTVPMPWCSLMAKGDQYIYDDWWSGNAYSGNKNQTGRALQVCHDYEKDKTVRYRQDRLDDFYPELK
mmetsp:Transcript_63208/g.179768  ORF Transcript_63208/g.179768 Transcript_63208/m.179768 type:complete len:412 (-) Transcript_63208:185-1420(-)